MTQRRPSFWPVTAECIWKWGVERSLSGLNAPPPPPPPPRPLLRFLVANDVILRLNMDLVATLEDCNVETLGHERHIRLGIAFIYSVASENMSNIVPGCFKFTCSCRDSGNSVLCFHT
jgi:hypothetical protein